MVHYEKEHYNWSPLHAGFDSTKRIGIFTLPWMGCMLRVVHHRVTTPPPPPPPALRLLVPIYKQCTWHSA